MRVAEVVVALQKLAPLDLAEEWDNVGLLAGAAEASVARVMLCIDLTAPVLAEAIAQRAQMVLAYHSPIFKPISRVTAQASPIVYQAVRAGLSVYSPHTALDAAPGGTDDVLADVLGLVDRRPLLPIRRQGECKLVVFTPPEAMDRISRAAFDAGAGRIGQYYDCAYFSHGVGAFCGGPGTHPTIGQPGKHEAVEELRLELLAPCSKLVEVLRAVRAAHPYEQPAIDAYPLQDVPEGCGSGRVGRLAKPATVASLLGKVKRATGLSRVLLASPAGSTGSAGAADSVRAAGSRRGHTSRGRSAGKSSANQAGSNRSAGAGAGKRLAGEAQADGQGMLVMSAAVGAGAAGSRYQQALEAGASFFLTGEMRHHEALAATGAGMTVVCVGHSNSERIALVSLADRLKDCCQSLEVIRSSADLDPFQIA